MSSGLGLALLEALLVEELAVGAAPGERGDSPLHEGPGHLGLVVVLVGDDVVDGQGGGEGDTSYR